MQSTQHILMIRPASFQKNEETAKDNQFQKSSKDSAKNIRNKAIKEFDGLVEELRKNGVNVYVLQDTDLPVTPDALFPNNWISTHNNGEIGVYPMKAENRRLERRDDVFSFLDQNGFLIEDITDYSEAEEEEYYLEGTGAIVLDRANEIAYCGRSERAHEDVFIEFCEDFEFFPVLFDTTSENGNSIYHTNVLMSITSHFMVVCLDVIKSKSDKKEILSHAKRSCKEILSISEAQMNHFCGNVLEVKNERGELILVMSTNAFTHFTKDQKSKIEQTHQIIHTSLETIEQLGGGSARCMMAEIFLPLKK